MTAKIIDGNAVARHVRGEWKKRVEALKVRGITPGLSVIIIGNNPASRVYVRNKVKACAEVGLHSEVHEFPVDAGEQVILERIEELNRNPAIHGILVQLPMPPHLEARRLLGAISIDKDVDGFHLYNVGGLVVGENNIFPPCTPYGVQCLLEYENIPIEGQNVVVVGASNIVGKPMALMLMAKDATVSICHIKTRDLAQFTILADILIVAAGCPRLITAPMVKRGAAVIDVGINRLADGTLAGDVDFDGVKEKASFITPVPGGVGPMTVTMLICNTVAAAERNAAKQGERVAVTS
ncbi:MAG: methenyltetrahydrofolate cyclohydrolase [Betaproteobacteria bacterium]|nr:methenyltetrahydrofolate cyclohydrolase [Betaproteobacteria bacterium]